MPDETFLQLWLDSDKRRRPRGGLDQATLVTQRNYELTVLISTLVDQLAESGAIDRDVLLAIVEGKLENEVRAPKVATKPGVAMSTCVRCQSQIPMSDAEMTTKGLMCGRCAMNP